MKGNAPDYGPGIEVRRSRRRRKTYSARAEGDRVVVMAPADVPPEDERRQVLELVEKVRRKTSSGLDNVALARRAEQLNRDHLEGRASFDSIRWVRNMSRRWGSVSYDPVRIRISHRLAAVPGYVLDDVILHELVHTFITTGHSDEFWDWARRAPHHERARGYLEAYQRWGAG